MPQKDTSHEMYTIARYRAILKEALLYYAQFRPSHGNIRVDVVLDEVHDRYAMMTAGWNRGAHVCNNIFYATIHAGKVYLEHDGIGYGISDDLIARGIPEEDIVLTWMQDPLPDLPKHPINAAVSR